MSYKRNCHLTVTTLSPLHIGSGNRLQEGIDFLEHEGALWIVNQRRLLNTILDEAEADGEQDAAVINAITGMSLYDLQEIGRLRIEHFDPARGIFKYHLRGATSTTGKKGELHEQIKTVEGKPYLPGSSLKGALRTMLAWNALHDTQYAIQAAKLGRRAKSAAQPVERDLFGRDSYFDLLRGMHVEDGVADSHAEIGLVTARLVPPTQKRSQFKIDLEAVPPGTVFRMSLVLDDFLLSDGRASELALSNRKAILDQFVRQGDRYSRQRLPEEINFHKKHTSDKATLLFYASLVKSLVEHELDGNEWLMQLGWGTGWDNKTFGSQIRKSEREYVSIVEKYGLHVGPGTRQRNRPSFHVEQDFPKTRKVVTMRTANLANQPPGWVKVRLDVPA